MHLLRSFGMSVNGGTTKSHGAHSGQATAVDNGIEQEARAFQHKSWLNVKYSIYITTYMSRFAYLFVFSGEFFRKKIRIID